MKKRLLYFTQNYSPHDFRFLSKLAGTEYDTYYMQLESGYTETRRLPAGVRQVTWDYDKIPFDGSRTSDICKSFWAEVERIQPNVIHAGPLDTCAYIASIQSAIPVVGVSWGYDVSLIDEIRDRRVMNALRYSDHVIYDSTFTKTRGDIEWQSPLSKISVIPWGTSLKQFPFKPKQRGQYYVILHNRPHWDRYHFKTVIRGFISARGELPNLRMIVMGSPTYLTAQAKASLLDAGYTNSVWFTKTVSEDRLAAFYHLSDLYLSACPTDGTSISLLNAMACGNQILVADTPSNAEWVSYQERFPVGDSQMLAAEIIDSCHTTSDTRRSLRRANLTHVQNDGDWDKNFEKFLAVYKSVSI